LNIRKLNQLILRLDSHWKTKQCDKCNQSEESIHFANLTQSSVRVHQSSSTRDNALTIHVDSMVFARPTPDVVKVKAMGRGT
jgi:hypothetical protein